MAEQLVEKILPYNKDQNKGKEIAQMFDNISHRYDFLNQLFSLGIDKIWRKKAIEEIEKSHPDSILDIATGTADLAIAAANLTTAKQIIGIDLSEGMLAKGREKVAAQKLQERITLQVGDSLALPFSDNSFDAITVAFGVRNFASLDAGLKEMNRVLKKDHTIAVLEFSKPKVFPVKQLFGIYFRYILPFVGKVFSKDAKAYTYLPASVAVFPEGEDFASIMDQCGFKNISIIPLSFGICTLYSGTKK